MPNLSTLVDLLQSRARSHPERTAYIFLLDGETEAARLTYGELDTRARAVAALLQKEGKGSEGGERCLLLFPPGLEFIEAFFGCLYAGVIAVPAYPPRPGREQPRLEAIAGDARPLFALTTAAIAAKVPAFASAVPVFEPVRWLVAEGLPAGLSEEWREPDLSEDTLAFLQYTSGSTASPKGVEVSHGNLLAMEALIRRTFEQDEKAVIVGWLPVYHDMGLIGNVLQPLYLGASCVLMSPVAFLRRPRRWLEAIHRYRATTSGGPNFAWDLCVDRISEPDREGLDLSSWKVAFNGAEPVRAATLERFAAAFAPSGFRREAFQPCYGLAEATLLVSGVREPGGLATVDADAAALEEGRIEEAADGARGRTLVGCGTVPEGLSVEIVDPATSRRSEPDRVGEIWVEAGPAIPRGYWSRSEATHETFEALLANGEGSYLRTGDLGFLRDGQVYVTGRLKDLIILRGRNHYPQDLELTAERSATGLATAGGAAFSVEAEGEERLVLALELAPRVRPSEEQIAELAGAIRRAVAEEHEVQVWDVVLLRPGALPKTSSGKVQRALCRRLYLDGELDTLGHSRIEAEAPKKGEDLDRDELLELPPEARAEAIEAWLRGKAAEVLRVRAEDLDGDRPLIDLGLDSLAAIELGHAVEVALGVELPVSAVLEGAGARTLAELVASVSSPIHGASARSPGIDARADDRPQGQRLSQGQRGLWFLHRLNPSGAAYHLTAAARLHGDVSAETLRASFQALTDRHEALRSNFSADSEGEPFRIVHPSVEVDFTTHDAAGWDDAELSRRIEEAAFLPFDLERGPLLRVSLFERGASDRSLVLSVHHIAADFWSFGVLVRDLSLSLSGVALEPAPRYGDFVGWQTAMLAGPVGERLQRFWDERLRGLPVLDLPLERPREGEPGSVCQTQDLGPELADRIRALGRERGATLFATLLAAYQTLLHRYSGQTDLAVGSPAAGRPSGLSGVGETVGYFTNPLVLRADLSGDPGFAELLARTRRQVLEALEHADLPFPLLVERLRPEQGRAPLFRTLLVLHRPLLGQADLASFALGEGGGRLDLGPLTFESLPLPPRSAQFDLDLHLGERRGGLGAALVYDSRVLESAAAERLLGHFASLLAAAVEDPEAPISSLALLSAPEQRQLLGWNATATVYPETSIPQLFEEQAGRTPDAPAVTFEGETLSYRQLAERVRRLAHLLQDLGVGPEVRVGIALERSLELVVALLAVLEAGGSYVPLDLSYPDERLSLLIADTGSPVVLTLTANHPRLVRDGVTVVSLDALPAPGSAGGRGEEEEGLLPQNAAYVIYTSGSTGMPKGVVNTHAGIANRLLWMQDAYRLDSSDAVLQKTPFTFDVSVWEFFWPLITGARLVLAQPGGHRDPAYLLRLIAEERITTAHFVPSMLQIFVEEPGVEHAGLQRVVASGEALPADLARRFFERLPGTELHNLYGPTEAAVDVTAWACEPDADLATLPIGRPIANLEIHILDRSSRPVPVGLPGELQIGGAGLARGYLNRPDLTAERFVPRAGGERLYRTGDLARFRADGAIEYLGRLDHQVKIRGFRVEPGEVEATLALHPEVREAAVLPLADGSALAAYFVAPAGSEPAPSDLRTFLASRLPEYMVPSAWIRLESLPLTSNGKLDRKALARIEPDQPREAIASAEPRGPVEELLAALWAELLGRERVGREDDFFASGGHSLLAARIVARVREAFGVELPLNAVFEASTPAALARRIGAARGSASGSIPLNFREAPLPLSFAQERLWFLDRLQPGQAAYNMPVSLHFQGPLDLEALSRALDEIVRRHEVLRTTFGLEADQPVQRVHPPASVPLAVIDRMAEESGRLLREEAARPFDLERGPLFRATLLRIDPADHRLLLTLHHTVADGASLEILLAELGALYTGSSLPELPLQFADYAAWEREHLTAERLAPQLAYWESRLAGAAPLELPADRPRPAVRSLRGAALGLDLGGLSTVSALARDERATLFLTLLAAFEALLFRYTGQADLVLGTPVAQRSRIELEPMIGPLLNTIVLRTALSSDLVFRDLLAEVRRVTLEAVQHSDLPFEALVDHLRPERSLGQNPFFQVTFALQQATRAMSLPGGLTVEASGVETGTAKFDLSLTLLADGDRLSATLEYAAELFDAVTAARLLSHFETLISGLDPSLPIGLLPLLSSAERHQLLAEWNATDHALPFVPVHERFERQTLATPDALAVSSSSVSLTYAELNDRAEQLARHLFALGLVPEDVVGVLAERSADKIVGALAVLKAGGAYAPLDPSWPDERLAFVLADARMPFLLAQSHLSERVPERSCRVLLFSPSPRGWECGWERGPGGEGQGGGAHPGRLAYVIYTSGSTGTPKGVALHHAGLANLIDWHHGAYAVSPADRATQIASVAFDASVWEIWPYLTAGASLHIPPEETRLSPSGLARWLDDQRITLAFLPTPLAELILDESPPSALRTLLTGGDRLHRRPSAEHPFRLINHYGPTEATVVATAAVVVPETDRAPSIGRPIANVHAQVLDRSLGPVPIGIPGELFLAGAGLARGYLHRPDPTAESFVPSPFGEGSRLYRTGDLARTLPDGRIEFLRRIDHQVKVKGFRIELGEIEAVLRGHSAVRDAAVLPREDHPGEPRLVAYVALRPGAIQPSELRAFLRGRLPDYMVPALFVALESLPLNPNGKVDRAALARLPLALEDDRSSSFVAPRDPIEETLAAIWRDVLRLERIGAHDGFFDLGGHSLLATQVTSRVRSALGIDLPLRALFEAPTLADLAGTVRRELSGGAASAAPPLVSGRNEEPAPLSFSQQRLWLLDRLEPGSVAYNLPAALRLRGELDPRALSEAIGGIVQRQGALRTTFAVIHGEAVQALAPPHRFALPVIDLSVLAGSAEEEAHRIGGEEALRPFDLERGPLFRPLLLRLATDDHVLAATMHHIVSDGWSMGVLLRELGSLYARAPLPPLPVQYPDFARWQRVWLQGEILEREIEHWRRRLEGMPPFLELPADRARPAVRTSAGASHPFDLSPELSTALRGLSRAAGATPFMVFTAAFQAMVGRLSGQRDFGLGIPIAGRNRLEIEGLIGFFVNSLVLRADLSGGPSFRPLLERVRMTTLDAYAHQDLPFEKLVEELAPERSLAHTPLFQVMLAWQGAVPPLGDAFEASGLRAEPFPLEEETAKLDLTLSLAEESKVFTGRLDYSRDLFDGTTIDRFSSYLSTLLAGALAQPEAPLADLPLLPSAERRQILEDWSATAPPAAPSRCVHELFEEQAERMPDAAALVSEAGTLTYRELRNRAISLAARLRDLGVGPEKVIGLCAGRTPELIVGMIGIMRSGAAYLPLDPAYPKERLAFLVEDSAAELILSEERWRERLPEGAEVLGLDGYSKGTSSEPAKDLWTGTASTPENLAYLLHTSGSTGRPKGVMVPHGGLGNLAAAQIATFEIRPGDRVLQFASPSFDASVSEIWTALLAGAELHLAEAGRLTPGPGGLQDLLAERRITHVTLPPSVLAALPAGSGPDLRTLVVAGESCPPELARGWIERVRLVDAYGPTEATVCATAGEVPRRDLAGPRLSIGRPIAGAEARVLGLDLELLPAGAVGELCLGGAGLARGYRGQPSLTAERFVPDPFGEAGARLYRTGDLTRWLPDGRLDFLGRLDAQVKIRGFRIEPGEVEVVLARHPAVREAAVIPREGALIGYVVSEASGPELRAWLAGRLPAHLVPAAVVAVPSFPHTPNGKVDRRALARIEPGRSSAGEPPRGFLEETLAAIYAEVLRLPANREIGRSDSFFDLGGHSLLATQATSRIQTAFGVELPLRAVFEAPSLAALGERIAEARGGGEEPAMPLVPISRDEPAPLSFAQGRLWFLSQLEPGSTAYNLPLAVLLEGALDVAALGGALAGIAERHEPLRTTFPSLSGEPVQEVGERNASFPFVDLSGLGELAEAEGERLAGEDARLPFDLERGPLFRPLLLRLAPETHLLLATMHHIASDGWSMGVFVREVAALYVAEPLPPLPIQYRDYAVWQRHRLSGERLAAEVDFWRGQLAGLPPRLELPADRPRPPVRSMHGGRRPFHLSAELAAALRSVARTEGATLFMVLLAGFQALLGRLSGQDDFAVGTPVAGRTRTELEGLIGFFVNTLVLRADLAGDPNLRMLLTHGRERALAAQAHQELPFEKLVEELAPQRDLGQTPLFQVMLVLQNTPGTVPSLPGLRLTARAPETGTAKLDLLLSLEEREDGLAGSLEFSRDLFDPPSIDRLLGHYAALLACSAAEPGQRLSAHSLLSAAERQQLLDWNATAKAYPRGAFIPNLFEAQADQTPDAPAVTFDGETWSYRRLDEEASRLARHLRRLGVGPEVPVGVALERSHELVLALLAVLKVGAAYVPLDLAHPDERLASLVADTGAPVVLTLEAHRPRFAAQAVALDADREAIDRERPERLEIEVSEESLAYILFTSGSTGTPKGAMNTHAGIANRLLWMQDAYGLDGSDSVLQKTPFTFDVSVWEFFWPLIVGARLVMARPEGHRDPDYLLRTIEEEKITTLHFVPSMLQVFLDGIDGEGRGPSLRRVMSSGEALSTELARRFFERFPAAGLHNLYGPTEAAVDVTAWSCTPEMEGTAVPIGRPISNLFLRILDRAAGLVPVGAPGELCIGGVGLARGYANRPDLTAAAFVPDPEGVGARLYRTGDLARYRPDGAIEYLGRIDHQVKIRGVRIEPGEIEAALARHPGIKDGAVGVQEAAGGDKRLIAYVVTANGDLSQEALRAYLRDRLPEAMVPSAFVVLPALPLTPNGKLDRRALASLGLNAAAPARRTSAPPRTAAEEAIAGAWREVLGAGSVGVDDNFFDLGGHSLLLVKAHRLLRERFPEVTVLDLFRYPTVGALAQFLTREKVDQISLAESRERGEARADRARRQKERRQVVRDPTGRKRR